MNKRDHFVYWLYAEDGTCLYVGCTRSPMQRWEAHRFRRKDMVAEVAYRRMAGPYEFKTARRIEREQQDILRPKYDRRLSGYAKAARTRAGIRPPAVSSTGAETIGSTEACRILGIHQVTLARWVSRKRITPFHKLPKKNGAYFFKRTEVEQLRDELAAEASA